MSVGWGRLQDSFAVSELDIGNIIDGVQEKQFESQSNHKEDVPNLQIDLRQILKIHPEHAHIIQLQKWIELQEGWLKTKDIGLSSFDLEEIPSIPDLEIRSPEKVSVKNPDKNNIDLEEIPPIPDLEIRSPEKVSVKNPDKNKLDKDNAQQLLKKAICLQAAIGGFTNSHQIPLDVLVDATAEYMTNMGKLYVKNLENDRKGISTGFSDPLERTLFELNIPGIRELDTFYRNRISGYRRKLVQKCKSLKQDCERKVNQIYGGFGVPDDPQPDSSEDPFKIGTTFSLNDEASNESAPQLRLGDAAIPGLEQGLRMLQSLEEGMDLEF